MAMDAMDDQNNGNVKMGGRVFKLSPGQREIARHGEWVLHLVPPAPGQPEQEWTSLKLYLDRPKTRKRVWYLGANGRRLSQGWHTVKLEKKCEGISDWILAAVNGVQKPAPPFPDKQRKNYKPFEEPDDLTTGQILMAMQAAWEMGTPWNHKPQSRSFGRYAVDIIEEKFGIHPLDAKQSIEKWLREESIESAIYDKRSNKSGLKLTIKSNPIRN